MRKILLAIIFWLFAVQLAAASICSSLPYTFTNGTTADAGQVNANFAALQNCVNTNAASNGVNANITQLTGLTAPPSGAGSLVFAAVSVTGSTGTITVSTTNPSGYAPQTNTLLILNVPSGFTMSTTTTLVVGGTNYNVVKIANGTAVSPVAGDITATTLAIFSFDGTSFELESPHDDTPSTEIGMFYASSCPTGWLAANGSSSTVDMRGYFPRALDAGAGRDPNSPSVGTAEAEAVQALSLSFTTNAFVGTSTYNSVPAGGGTSVPSTNPYNLVGNISISGTGNETRPITKVLLACQKL